MRAIVRQFGNPHGFLGRLAGWIMATRPSNLERNRWTLDLLELRSTDSVLELGPGPGVTLGQIVERCPEGCVVGLDHSALMVERCRRIHRKAIAEGRLTVVHGDFVRPPDLGLSFDKILAVNSLQFDAMETGSLMRIVAMLKPGGTIAVTFQPRGSEPTEAKALAFADRVSGLLESVGLEAPRTEILPLEPVCAVCVLARKPCSKAAP